MDLKEKEAAAAGIIREGLSRPGGAAIATFGGGKDSVVMLHLLKRAGCGSINFPVLTLDPPKELHRLYYFIEKMACLWNFGGSWIRKKPGKDGDIGVLKYDSLFMGLGSIALSAASDGYSKVITGIRKDEEGAGTGLSGVISTAGFVFVNPLLEFTEEDVFSYINRYNLPCCSLYNSGLRKLGCIGLGGRRDVPYAGSSEDELIRSRLSALGYM